MARSASAQRPFDRIAAFRFVYAGIFAYVLLSVGALEGAESLLDSYFRRTVDEATRVSPANGPVIPQIQQRISERVHDSAWVRVWGVRVNAIVLAADGRTPVYLVGRTVPPPPDFGLGAFREADELLPAITTVDVVVPLDSLLGGAIWVVFGAVIVPILFVNQRALARRDEATLRAAVAARDGAAQRTRSIEGEIEKLARRLAEVEPAERAHADEIASLQQERASLQARLAEVGARERELREHAVATTDLDEERHALEELLAEAVHDLDQKENEILSLQERLKRASVGGERAGRTRGAQALAKRLATLYRNLEIDDRAVQDIAALGDESLRLRAEESLKRLDEGPEGAAVRRKVGGLPPQLPIFELGFAGKGRIYYARSAQRAFRVLAVGGKASQKKDLEYLSRVSLD